jgi:hypothetical protein
LPICVGRLDKRVVQPQGIYLREINTFLGLGSLGGRDLEELGYIKEKLVGCGNIEM